MGAIFEIAFLAIAKHNSWDTLQAIVIYGRGALMKCMTCKRWLISLSLMSFALVLLQNPAHAQCPVEFTQNVSDTEQEVGGFFYKKALLGTSQWSRLSSSDFSIMEERLDLIYIPPKSLCDSSKNRPITCGPSGFLIVKMRKLASDKSDTVTLRHGDGFSTAYSTSGVLIQNETYQKFHNEEQTQINRKLISWHQGTEDGDKTYNPYTRKRQFAFDDTWLDKGTREALLLRFGTSRKSAPICVEFGVTVLKQSTLDLEFTLIEPVSRGEYAPRRLELQNLQK